MTNGSKQTMNLALSTALTMVVFGCTGYDIVVRAPHNPQSLPPGVAGVCVVRPHTVAALVPAVVRDNGRLAGMTRGPSHFCYFVQPGHHRIVTTYGDDIDAKIGTDTVQEATLEAEPGQTYYLQHDVRKVLSIEVRWVSMAEGFEMMGDTDEVALSSVPSGERPPALDEVFPAAQGIGVPSE